MSSQCTCDSIDIDHRTFEGGRVEESACLACGKFWTTTHWQPESAIYIADLSAENMDAESVDIEVLRAAKSREEVIAFARVAHFNQTADRLRELIECEEDIEANESPLSVESIRRLLEFLLKHTTVREPSLVRTSSGHAKAMWARSKDQLFWIDFHPNGDVRYLAHVPNAKRKDGVERTASWSTYTAAFDRAEALGADIWMVR